MFFKKKKIKKNLSLSKLDQCNALFNQNFDGICDIPFSSENLNQCIDISFEEFLEFLEYSEILNKFQFTGQTLNGLYVKNETYAVLIDRGEIVRAFNLKTKDELVLFYSKFLISIVPRFSNLNPI